MERVVSILVFVFFILTFSSCITDKGGMSDREVYLVDSTEVATLLKEYNKVANDDYSKAQDILSRAFVKVNASEFKNKLLLQIIQSISGKDFKTGNFRRIDSLTIIALNSIPLVNDKLFEEAVYEQRAVFF